MMVKSLSKSLANNYDDQIERNVSSLVLKDKNGKEETMASLFSGKTVYMYVWKHSPLFPPGDTDSAYTALKRRFVKYDDVVFINVYNDNNEADWKELLKKKNKGVMSYQLSENAANDSFRELMGASTSPQIIGKDGTILSFLGPRPTDKLLVDYALDQARTGQNGTKSAKKLIKGINSKVHFKDPKLTEWYEKHYGKKPEGKLSVSISGTKGNVGL